MAKTPHSGLDPRRGAKILRSADDCLKHLGHTDDRFDPVMTVTKIVSKHVEGGPSCWRCHLADEKTDPDDESKIAEYVADIVELLPEIDDEEIRTSIRAQMTEVVGYTDLSAADETDAERIRDALSETVKMGIGPDTGDDDCRRYICRQLSDTYPENRWLDVEVTFSDERHDLDDIRAWVEGEVFDELLSIEAVAAYEYRDHERRLTSDAKDLLCAAEYRITLE